VDVARQNKLNFGCPLLDSLCLWLRPLIILLEVVRKVSVEIEASGIVPNKKSVGETETIE